MTPETSPAVVPGPPRRGRRLLLVGLSAAVLLVVGGGAYLWLRPSSPAPPELNLAGADPEAAAAIEKARADVVRRPRSPAAWGHLGLLLFAHDYYAEAEPCLVRAERLEPVDPHWPYFQGLILLFSDADAAVACFRRAVACRESDFNLRLRLAEALLALDRRDEADAEFRRVLELHPGNQRANLGLGQLAFRKGDAKASVPHLQAALTSNVAERSARALLAEAYHQLGDAMAAAREQEQAAELPTDVAWPDPYLDRADQLQTSTQARIRRATRLLNQGQVPQALAALEEVLEQSPDADEAYKEMGRAYVRLGRPAQAVPFLREAARRHPDGAETHFLLGVALHAAKDSRAAADAFRRAVELKPAYALAYFNLGQCLAEQGDRPGAIAAFRTALRYKPNLAPVHVRLAVLLAQAGQDADALVHVRQALVLTPDDAEAKKLREELEAKSKLP